MQHKTARRRAPDGRWDFTVGHDDDIHAIGYCTAFIDPDELLVPVSEADKERIRANKDKYHAHGHATKEEAEECYKQYLLDNRMRTFEMTGTMHQCQVCDSWTRNQTSVDNLYHFTLCDKHNNRETLEYIMEPPQAIWTS